MTNPKPAFTICQRVPGNHTTIHKALKKAGLQKDEMGKFADEFTENRVTELKVFNLEKGYFIIRLYRRHSISHVSLLRDTQAARRN